MVALKDIMVNYISTKLNHGYGLYLLADKGVIWRSGGNIYHLAVQIERALNLV